MGAAGGYFVMKWLPKSRSRTSATRTKKRRVEKPLLDTTSKEAVAGLKSKYMAPCACNSRQCCHTEHDTFRVLPLQSTRRTLCEEAHGEELHDEPPVSVLPSPCLDPKLPLLPLHWSVSDHLSFDKLASARRTLTSPNVRVFVPELSNKGNILTDTEARFDWFSHIYFRNGSFEQRCRVTSQMHRGSLEHYIACPHQSISVSEPTFGKKNGHQEVQAWVTARPPRCPSHPMERWVDRTGPYIHRTACRICDVDVECTIDVREGLFMRVIFTCRRGLGAGLGPSDPQWIALMTGNGQTK
ncbi:hypothetical protein M440DRAFT_1365970 [Trichoderma longibrachiatum ATCC 18648]|uniref:Uncharacterized protein n=1 Tax=Trichoderma longibrachiatum ATCC 18648 TaxID=983965 RepID=A0A2T4BPT9_TRILO|nr:hypothetical protein M440DRAFT_1365970 [Trichoderma longibrachiatum ATCC 18648]